LTVPPDLPESWRRRLSGYTFKRETIGESAAEVYRLDAGEPLSLFVKSEPDHALCELPGEIDRLRWLDVQGVPCPRVLDTATSAGRNWLLMTALPGRDLASSPDLATGEIIAISALALRRLHALDIATCPFDQRIHRRIAEARARLDAGLVDFDDFDEEHDPHSAFADLLATRPADEDLVVTHGDACFPNFLAQDGRFTGFVDCGRLGVADRWQDLALVCRSLSFNFGAGSEQAFLRAYGISELDAHKSSSYRLLDEFF
jgi:aminoglycoside 3'-phosphotransferase-2